MAVGRTGSFATLQAPNDPLLNTLQNIEQVGFQKRAEDRLIADKKKAEEEKRLAEDIAWDGKFDPTIVGNSKIDDPMLSMAFKAKEQVGQIRRELRNPNLSYDEKVRLNSKLNRISQSFDVANQTPKLLLQKAQEIAKNINNLDPEDVNIVEGVAKQLESGKYEMYYDENGTARIKIFNTDENGKPISILKETTLGNLINEFNPSPKSTYKEDLLKYAQSYKVSSTKTTDASGRTIFDKKVDRTPGSRDYQNAMEYAKTILVKPHERKKIAKISGIDVNDEQKLLEYATKDILQAIPDEYENLQDPRLLFDKQKEAKKEAEKEIIIGKPTVIKDEGKYVSGVKMQKGTKSHPLGNVIIDSGQGKKQKATNIYVLPGGKMYLRVEETGFEGGSQKTTRYTEKGLRRKAEAEKAKKKFVTEYDDIEDITVYDKKPIVKMLDFGKDQNEIGRFALKMGYDGAKSLMMDFIERSGGDEFIVTPDERKQNKNKKSKGSYDDI